MRGIEALDPAAIASAEARLAAILRACADADASVWFLPPLTEAAARGFWRRAAASVTAGDRVLLGAWADGTLAGTVTLDLATPPNQPHRAEIAALLVHPAFRRRGLAKALMAGAETEARRLGRRLLTLNTRAGGWMEELY
ncbi:MAG TPA: GNAT family N-acetyltransferase [Acetobacteraceae bacterium]|nr:GNAT family N-acetyltransferase [Acetobacteraceae bacterium]